MNAPDPAAPPAAEPEELREQIAEIVYDRDAFAGDDPWSRVHPIERERCRRTADRALALPALRQLLTDRAALARVRELVDELDGYTHRRGRPAPGSYDDGVNKAQADAADLIRRALDGDGAKPPDQTGAER